MTIFKPFMAWDINLENKVPYVEYSLLQKDSVPKILPYKF